MREPRRYRLRLAVRHPLGDSYMVQRVVRRKGEEPGRSRCSPAEGRC